MRTMATTMFERGLIALLLCAGVVGIAVAPGSALAANAVRISQVYGGGGNTGAQYNQDYIELFNSTNSAVNIGGWSIQYGAATGTVGFGGTSSQVTNIPANTMIAACSYFLISLGPVGVNGVAIPTPDLTGNASTLVSATGGKISLIDNQTFPTPCTGSSVGSPFVDVLGWGATANCYEGAQGPATSNTLAAFRANGGLTDTDVNSADFSSAAPSPRNSSSPTNCPPPPTGACCAQTGECTIETAAACAAASGNYLGDGVPCEPIPCATGVQTTTWGRLKTIYR